MAIVSLGVASRPSARWLATQIAVVVGGITTYFGVRGLTESSPHVARLNAEDIVALERRLGIDHEAAAQSLVIGSESLSTFANWVYIWGHWPVIIATLLWLAVRHRAAYERLRNAMVASGLIGIVVFVAYPVAPPRLADLGLVDTVTEQSSAYRVLQPPAFVNQYAAMPSLHVGWDLLVGLTVASVLSARWLRWAARVMPMLMVLSVVVTANHYLLDVFAGAAVALIGLRIAVLLERRRGAGVVDLATANVMHVPTQRAARDVHRDLHAAR
ncbi:MAG TPA: phosphatase PAP2 family protein [Mycobacteriales bacterium]|nr:phosphatase PAP2 family protein [Mycobacteriales bacterium]